MDNSDRGRFIVLDGPEGGGKSTQAARLCAELRHSGHSVVLTREPGGTPAGEKIREILLDPRRREITPLTELLLVCAARAQHVHEVIAPALRAGSAVISDRFTPSTIVYQGLAGGVPLEVVRSVDAAARGGLLPDLTIILDVPPEIGPWRGVGVQPSLWEQADRMEGKELEFHRRVREGYLSYVEPAEEKCVVISAEAAEDEVAAELLAVVLECIEPPEK